MLASLLESRLKVLITCLPLDSSPSLRATSNVKLNYYLKKMKIKGSSR